MTPTRRSLSEMSIRPRQGRPDIEPYKVLIISILSSSQMRVWLHPALIPLILDKNRKIVD